ncbi:21256_t:CDS:2 [Gigaspora rosea]|nr:21256_t:CDS:2 [Gigaspora rosea]
MTLMAIDLNGWIFFFTITIYQHMVSNLFTLVDRIESGHQEVTLVDIIYDISNREAKIVYEDYKKSISIKHSA